MVSKMMIAAVAALSASQIAATPVVARTQTSYPIDIFYNSTGCEGSNSVIDYETQLCQGTGGPAKSLENLSIGTDCTAVIYSNDDCTGDSATVGLGSAETCYGEDTPGGWTFGDFNSLTLSCQGD